MKRKWASFGNDLHLDEVQPLKMPTKNPGDQNGDVFKAGTYFVH